MSENEIKTIAAGPAWHALDVQTAMQRLASGPEGLSEQEAAARLAKFGPKRLRPPQPRGALVRFLLQFHNILIYVLLGSAVATSLLGHWVDTGVILGVVIVNAIIGFVQEGKAEKALEAIRNMLSLEATVIRDGRRQQIPADRIVPGDIVVLRTGDKVPADMRLIDSRELRVDEAMLTGESVPVEKQTAPLPEHTALGDRTCLAFSGTLVTSGQGTGLVISTGDSTELGKISRMVSETQAVATPLILQMNRFGHVLAVVILVLAAVTFGLGYYVGREKPVDLFLAAVALAVATIPEGLPAIMTIVLAIGVQRMARRNAIIRRLPAVDTLGALTVICSDKTGTLTRNEMTVTSVVTCSGTYEVTGVGYKPEGRIMHNGQAATPDHDAALGRLLRAVVLCNDSELVREGDAWRAAGDPMESALVALAIKGGLDADAVRRSSPAIDTIPFDSRNRFMATLHRASDGQQQTIILVKGAPEKLLEMCRHQLRGDSAEPLDAGYWEQHAHAMASHGQRVLAVAFKTADADKQRL